VATGNFIGKIKYKGQDSHFELSILIFFIFYLKGAYIKTIE